MSGFSRPPAAGLGMSAGQGSGGPSYRPGKHAARRLMPCAAAFGAVKGSADPRAAGELDDLQPPAGRIADAHGAGIPG